ncbi:helix-turn-helix transcriptional regulator [Curtobacterium sp. ISL-83]|uniref:helix-turn-helix transcriptional regulator n=1 Tax=Curtobacterium sp. ISL-83 TaxID=2819145 RepID=UPI001BE63EF1|nr:helix-turn-helix transcriptional regulator [Curtobacterium sp. ISL-83]MBT2504085.1 helix-turn-helix transcriptional regulator [Curtobacterium sp. ISL-83]
MDQPLTVADVAAAVGLSARGLQEGFQRATGRTPTAYLRDVRLDYARHDLLRGGPDATTVRGVARRWGFTHLGRLAQSYMERHGEYPSTTLRRETGTSR